MNIQENGKLKRLGDVGPGVCVKFDGAYFITTGEIARNRSTGIFAVSLSHDGNSLSSEDMQVLVLPNAQVVVS